MSFHSGAFLLKPGRLGLRMFYKLAKFILMNKISNLPWQSF